MRGSHISAFVLAALFWALLAPLQAHAQAVERWDLCVREAAAGRGALGIAPPEAEALIREIASSIGINADSIVLIPCHRVAKATTAVSDGALEGVPAGEYVMYNEVWLREVIGADRIQAIAIFGHELGHLLNRDFYPPRSMAARATLETDADRFSGCAVARAQGQWDALEDLYSRLRGEVEGAYPNRLRSLDAARNGFESCGGQRTQQRPAPSSAAFDISQLPADFQSIVLNARITRRQAEAAANEAREEANRARSAASMAEANAEGQLANGVARFRGSNGNYYAGQVIRQGTMLSSRGYGVSDRREGAEFGDRYLCAFNANGCHGLGVIEYGDNPSNTNGLQRWEGQFSEGRLDGLGIMTVRGDQVFQNRQTDRRGRLIGQPGVWIQDDEDMFEGIIANQWVQGVLWDPAGNLKCVGYWRDGRADNERNRREGLRDC